MLDNESIYHRIISLVHNREWEAYESTMRAFLKELQAAPSALVAFASLVMQNCPKGGTFFDTALSFLPLEDWPIVVRDAMDELRRDPTNEAAQSIIECANLQCPTAILPYGGDWTVTCFTPMALSNWPTHLSTLPPFPTLNSGADRAP